MSRKYYCELCDKRFADNPQNRKNHMKGVLHQRMRKAHYDTFRDPAGILSEEISKKPCRTYIQTGECRFTPNCRFSHLTPEAKQDLERLVLEKKEAAKSKHKDYAPSLEQWLAKRAKKDTSSETEPAADTTVTTDPVFSTVKEYTLPDCLLGVPNLPISLLPPPPGSLLNLPVEEWG